MKGFLEFLARRYVAGSDRTDAVAVARALNASGIKATIDNLGENVKVAEDTERGVAEYLSLLELIDETGVDSTVSMKLTHLGLDISTGLALDNARRIVERAEGLGNFVRIDMEGSPYTERTLEVVKALAREHGNVGVAIQSALKRSREDVGELVRLGISVRLVKGAYKEPAEIAFEDKADVDENFSLIMKMLLAEGTRPAIATHDEKLIDEAREIARGLGKPNEELELQMLLGIKRTLQMELTREGYLVRVYIPYGTHWLPYMTRRLRERRENLFFVLKNILD